MAEQWMHAPVGSNLLDKVIISSGLLCFQVMNDSMPLIINEHNYIAPLVSW